MKFLVAVDGSDQSGEALAHAVEIAGAADGSIVVVHVVEPAVYDEGGSEPISGLSDAEQRLVVESIADAERRGTDVLDEAAARAEALGHDVGTELLYGNPVAEIADFAEDERFDAIVVGHRGRSERTERMLGSVAKTLIERASVPVTVVR